MRILVVGAGVTGLTVGVRLAEAGLDVHLLARELPLETTSAVAAALWYPYRIAPEDRVAAWSMRSYAVFRTLAECEPDCGVVLRDGVEVVRTRGDAPAWTASVPGWRRLEFAPPPYRDGWTFPAPVIEMPVYLEWLRSRLEAGGGTLTRMALAELPDTAGLVVNCSGLGARRLAGDASVEPVRGQVVRLSQVGLQQWMLDAAGPTYVVPRSHDIVVGGTDEEGEWDLAPDAAVAEKLLARATALVPELRDAQVLGHRVGLRPARGAVRLERVPGVAGRPVIHCYGQGGAGVTVSWGCADEVLRLVDAPA